MTRAERAWQLLDDVLDPEVPALSVRDLGIVRDVIDHGEELEVVLTPTYSGCPATEVIEQNVLAALQAGGVGPARATLRRAPAWTTDWISEEGRRKLRAYGIAPPSHVVPADVGAAQADALDSRLRGNDNLVVPAQAGTQSEAVVPAQEGTRNKAVVPAQEGTRNKAVVPAQAGTQSIMFFRRKPQPVPCPHCGSAHTERLSAFGSTACKALHRCLDCREPFEHFKPI